MNFYPLLFSIDVQPIPPSQIVEATKSAGQGAVGAGQALAGSLASVALLIAGLVLLVGIGLSLARITNKVLSLGAGIFLGVVVMYVFLVYPEEIVGTISGFLNSFFSHLKPAASAFLGTWLPYC